MHNSGELSICITKCYMLMFRRQHAHGSPLIMATVYVALLCYLVPRGTSAVGIPILISRDLGDPCTLGPYQYS